MFADKSRGRRQWNATSNNFKRKDERKRLHQRHPSGECIIHAWRCSCNVIRNISDISVHTPPYTNDNLCISIAIYPISLMQTISQCNGPFNAKQLLTHKVTGQYEGHRTDHEPETQRVDFWATLTRLTHRVKGGNCHFLMSHKYGHDGIRLPLQPTTTLLGS